MILLNDEKTDRIYFHCTANKCQNFKDTLTIHYDSTYHGTEVEFDCRTRILQSYIAKSTGQVIIYLLLMISKISVKRAFIMNKLKKLPMKEDTD